MNAQKRMEEAISKQIYDRGHDRDHPDTDNLHGNFCGSHVEGWNIFRLQL